MLSCVCLKCKILPFWAARFRLPVTVLTRYETLVETVYSSLDEGMLGVCGAATRFDFEDPSARGSRDFAEGSLLGSGSLFGSDDGSLFGSELGSGSLLGSDEGSGLAGSLDGSLVGSGSLDGSGADVPGSKRSGNFLHSAVSFLGLHPNPTHDVPLTTSTISISLSSFKIRQ